MGVGQKTMSSDDELGYDEPGYNAQVYELRAYIDICISQNDEISPHTLVTMVLAGAILTDEYDRVTNLPDNHSCKRPQYVDFWGSSFGCRNQRIQKRHALG